MLTAAVTACFVPPDAAYAGYFDWKTLSCLFCVLAVVCALRSVGLFPVIARQLLQLFGTATSVGTALVLITLVGSMLLTNDTALLTFLPLSWMVLQEAGQEKADRLCLYPAKLRRQLRRYVDPLRESPEPISVRPLSHSRGPVPVHYAAAVCPYPRG